MAEVFPTPTESSTPAAGAAEPSKPSREFEQTDVRLCEGCGPAVEHQGATYCCGMCAHQATGRSPAINRPLAGALVFLAGWWLGRACRGQNT